jgi:tetratricopeptide (TPR) repeat protein
VLKGIYHFEKSIEYNQNDRFQNLKFDAHFYIGKAYLLINDKVQAEKHFKIVIDNKGSFYKDAEKLLNSIK